MSNWISVSQQKPTDGEWVLGTVGDVVIPKLEESYSSGKPVMLLEC